jgi:hypothetical protein
LYVFLICRYYCPWALAELIRYHLAAVPMIHDTSSSRASTACHYSPSLVAEEQLHGSKDTLTLKGEKALLELLLGMVCVSHSPRSLLYYLIFITISDPLQALDQHVDGRKLITQQEAEDSDFESYLREATSRVLYQPTFMYGRQLLFSLFLPK